MLFANAATIIAQAISILNPEKHVEVRYRAGRRPKTIVRISKHIHDSVVTRVKIISNLDITNRRASAGWQKQTAV